MMLFSFAVEQQRQNLSVAFDERFRLFEVSSCRACVLNDTCWPNTVSVKHVPNVMWTCAGPMRPDQEVAWAQ